MTVSRQKQGITVYEKIRLSKKVSRENACHSLHMSNQQLFEIEKGTKTPSPETILAMAEIYKAQDMPLQYCRAECPIGKIYQFSVDRKTLAEAVLTLLKEINDLEEREVENSLIKIVANGKVDKQEEGLFVSLMDEIADIVKSFFDLRSSSGYLDIKKAPAFADAGSL